MKKSLMFFVLFSANCAVSQSLPKQKVSKNNATENVVSPAQIQAHNDSVQKLIQQVEGHLNSIQIKWDYIENDAAEKQLATDNGWFEKMTAVKNRLIVKKQLLTDSLK